MMTMDDEYYSYPAHKNIPLLDSLDDAMSSSSDSDKSQSVSKITFSAEPVSRKWIKPYNTDDLDPGLGHIFQTLIRGVPGKIGQLTMYPPCYHKEMKRNNKDILNSIRKLNCEQCFVFAGNSLVSTLNIANNSMTVPKGIRSDVCIISKDNPVLLLTFVENENNIEKKEKYNELLTREITNILRTFMDETVSIVSGVIVKGTDLKTKIQNLQDDAKTSFFVNYDASTLSVEDGTWQSAITALLIGISRAPTYQFIEGRPGVIWTLSPEEVEIVLEHIDDLDGCTYTSTLEDPCLLLEIASRKSRRRFIRLDLTKQQYSKINISQLRRWYPNLEVTSKAVSERGTIQGELLRGRDDTKADEEEVDSTSRSKRAIKRRKKVKNQQKSLLGNGGPTVRDEHGRGNETRGIQRKDSRKRSILNDYRFIYSLIVVVFLLRFHTSVASSVSFCLAKCSPLVYLIYVVGKEFLLYTPTHKKGLLLFGLVCSCIGDALFVWKKQFFELGVTFFSLGHISYGFGCGLKPIGLRKLLYPLVATFPIFLYYTWKLHGITWVLLSLYVIALNIMGWRVIATVKCLWCYELVTALCFLISNISILVEMSETPYPCSHQISMVSYYTGQLGMVISILKRSREEVKSQECRHRTIVFIGVVIPYVLFFLDFQVFMLISRERYKTK